MDLIKVIPLKGWGGKELNFHSFYLLIFNRLAFNTDKKVPTAVKCTELHTIALWYKLKNTMM